ncbi:restriction endonuclease subunit S [Bacteroides uniformis]|uniref:restriction endonuclease subunit S n=1 Tax=Bacteroides uniformis TaxID=820 RepID=UPI0020CACDEA|nr:restriction endonuclease subunit S [Bacteroides uniformis]
MAIDNKDKKILNVPHLRFPEFSGEWEMVSLQDIATINPKSDPLQNTFIYIDLEAVEKGELRKIQEIMREEAPSRAQRVIDNNDILFQCVRPYQKNNYIHRILNTSNQQWVASTGYAQIRTTELPNYIYHLLNTDEFNRKVMVRCTGSSYPAINSEDLATIHLYYTPDKKEQLKISRLLDLLDKRIATQNKIIEDLKKLKSAIRKKMFSLLKDEYTESFEINQLLDYEQPTAYIVANDEYSTDTSLTPVLTANKGFILGYTDEKFGIYQKGECIIFDDFTMDAKYVSFPFKVKSSAIKILTAKPNVNLRFMFEYLSYWELKSEEHKRHYISEIASLVIELPSKERQSIIASLMTSLNSKLDIEAKTKIRYEEQKRYLLSQMFI